MGSELKSDEAEGVPGDKPIWEWTTREYQEAKARLSPAQRTYIDGQLQSIHDILTNPRPLDLPIPLDPGHLVAQSRVAADLRHLADQVHPKADGGIA